jgi:hypothetical protein
MTARLMRVVIRKARSLARQPVLIWLLLVPSWVLLGLARALILARSFQRLSHWLGRKADGLEPVRPVISPHQATRAVQIGRVIRMAARYTPWTSNCFPQAVVARVFLGLFGIPYALYFGLRRDLTQSEMQAHAWVVAGDVPVTGGESFSRYTAVGVYLSPRSLVKSAP